MKKIISIVTALPVVFTVASCDLDQYPYTSYNEGNVFVPKDTSSNASQYTTAVQIENLVKGWYNNQLKGDLVQRLNFQDWLVWSEVRADNAYCGVPSTGELVAIESNKIDGSNLNVTRSWSDFQKLINAANQVICNVDNVQKLDPSLTQSMRDEFLAQGYIMKSWAVFRGMELFGTIPVINIIPPAITADNLDEVYDAYYPARSSKEEIYSQLIQMLEFAAQKAPALDPSDKFKLSRTFAKSLLAHVYAERSDIQDWNKVAEWCSAVEADMGVATGTAENLRSSLCDKYSDMWSYSVASKTAAKNTKESIFEVTFTNAQGNWLHMMYHRNQFDPDANYTWQKWCTPSRNLVAAFDKAGDTERKNQTIIYDKCSWSTYYPSDNYAFMGKMETNATSVIFARLAEVYLLHAEALTETGDIAGAMKYVNAVRLRAGLAKLSGSFSQEEMIDKVLDERRLELAFEGYRFFDLVRHNKAIAVHNSVWKSDSYCLTRADLDEYTTILPVPTDVLDTNPNIEQNPGY